MKHKGPFERMDNGTSPLHLPDFDSIKKNANSLATLPMSIWKVVQLKRGAV